MIFEKQAITIFFDDDCLLCNNVVQFLLPRTPNYVIFSPLNGLLAKKINLNNVDIDSIAVFENGEIYFKSKAIFKIVSQMKWPWKLLQVIKVFPSFFLDFCYDFVAKNRKKWFGFADICHYDILAYKNRIQ